MTHVIHSLVDLGSVLHCGATCVIPLLKRIDFLADGSMWSIWHLVLRSPPAKLGRLVAKYIVTVHQSSIGVRVQHRRQFNAFFVWVVLDFFDLTVLVALNWKFGCARFV